MEFGHTEGWGSLWYVLGGVGGGGRGKGVVEGYVWMKEE